MRLRLLLALPLAALVLQGPWLAAQAQPSADTLARALQQRYDTIRDFKATFAQMSRGGALGIQSKGGEGTVSVKKPGRMRWEYTKPEKQLIVSDGVRLHTYYPDSKEADACEVPPDEQAPTATLFLSGKGNILRDFKVSSLKSPVAGTSALRLDPRKGDPDYEYLVVAFDPASYQMRGLVTHDRQGGESTIVFSDMKENTNIPDKTFSFTPPKGTHLTHCGRI